MKISMRIYKYRVKNNLTQEEMGALIGLARENVAKLENGKYKPSKRIITKINMLERGL